jgi:hypothetical protein
MTAWMGAPGNCSQAMTDPCLASPTDQLLLLLLLLLLPGSCSELRSSVKSPSCSSSSTALHLSCSAEAGCILLLLLGLLVLLLLKDTVGTHDISIWLGSMQGR